MVSPKATSDTVHVENSQHEAQLSGAIALASLFSTCVEAFGLIHPSQKWEKQEQLLLTRLGLQQARLLIWASVLGVSSPPASVTDRAVPKRPSSAYPDLKEPTFFDPRDPRLDEPQIRTTIEEALSAIVDRSSAHTREDMMSKFGLKPPKRFSTVYEQALDLNRLESWREKYELLREVAETYAQINTRRANSLVHTSWAIADVSKFGTFIELIQEKVDFLIEFMDLKERVDRAMRMDIRVLGWHVTFDRARTAVDISKLRLLQEICKQDYPEYTEATQQALDNISRENRESIAGTYVKPAAAAAAAAAAVVGATANGDSAHAHKKRPGVFNIFRSFGKNKADHHPGHSRSVSGPSLDAAEDMGPVRSVSDAGPAPDQQMLGRIRSKSIGGYLDPPELDEDLRNKLDKMTTRDATAAATTAVATQNDTPAQHAAVEPKHETVDSPIEATMAKVPVVSGETKGIVRHDQYHGIARVETKYLNQPGADFSSG